VSVSFRPSRRAGDRERAANVAGVAWAFEFVEVRHRLDGSRVLDGVSFGARVGEAVALAGPSGSGKTIAFRLIAGLDRADEGAVVVAGKDVARSSKRVRRRLQRRLAFVFQGSPDEGYALFESADVLENVTFPMREVGRVPGRRLMAVAREELDRFGLADHAHLRPSELDRDARKRLALARALALRSPLVVIDALEDGLRPDSIPVVVAALEREHADRGTSLFVTTRDAALGAVVADRVVHLAHPAAPHPPDDRPPSALIRR
jgi:ABC-type transporter Mla maintaining outer membrane lipid asymmetry ATPase subunit MlaF